MTHDALSATIDPRVFIKQLAPDQLGVFEPLSGLMLLNISKAELQELAGRLTARRSTEFDVAIMRTINHEAYHFAQTAASGYSFQRQCQLFAVFNGDPEPEPPLDPALQALANAAFNDIGDDPELKLRYERTMAMLKGHRQSRQFEARAAQGDHSLMGTLMPDFFAHVKALSETEAVVNTAGLSILGVLEGSAVVHTHLLMHPQDDPAPHIQQELATLPRVYSELYDLTVARAGGRALELLLPAVTLALRYAQPHNAYGSVLALLAESAPGEALERGRSMANELPDIRDAGPLLGTAIDLRQQHDQYIVYDLILCKLATKHWGIDSYDFLAQPTAMHAVGSFPLGIVTTDGYLGSLDKDELAARVAFMGAVMRSRSGERAAREFRESSIDWGRDVLSRMATRLMDDRAPPTK